MLLVVLKTKKSSKNVNVASQSRSTFKQTVTMCCGQLILNGIVFSRRLNCP